MLHHHLFVLLMKCFCWNVRGLNGNTRKSDVQRWMHNNRPMFGAFLETHVKQDILHSLMTSTLPGWNFDSNHSPQSENGRIIVVWNPSLSVAIYFRSPQIMVCGIFDPASQEYLTVCFVYAFNERSDRLPLWDAIKQISRSSIIQDSPMLVLGDFNQVLASSEAYSLHPSDLSIGGMTDFQECLQQSEIFDLAFRGCFFTWSNKSPTSPRTRKLDRALINEAWIEKFPNSLAIFDDPGSSDHSPCIVQFGIDPPRRTTRFTFFTFFTSHPNYKELLEAAWTSTVLSSTPLLSFYQKLRAAKICCKGINREGFSNIEKRTKEAFEKLQDIQSQVLTDPTPQLFQVQATARDSWLLLAAAEQNFFKLKSRVRWETKGDLNTAFFHKSVKANLARNVIHFLTDENNRRVFDGQEMKNMVIRFYSYLQGRSNVAVTPYAVGYIREIHPYRHDSSRTDVLVAIPTDEEIREIVFSLPKCKAPGPDGFTSEFFTSSWDLVGRDLISAVQSFFLTSYMPRQTNATVISLIPKIAGASALTDFRPVSLCNTVYKIISKTLSARLKTITQDTVQRNQVGFVKGRVLCENVLLASELVADFHKRGRITKGCLQVDISKAFDSIKWGFILNILIAFNLPLVFISWIQACITTPYYSVALNGELSGFFPGKKGLRQGDSISSSLFVMAMDILSKELDIAVREGKFGAHPSCLDPLVTHLSFADDLLIFFDGTSNSLRGILTVLRDFQKSTGLALNLRKTCVFVNGENSEASASLASEFGITMGSLPVKYLGLPLIPHKARRTDYQPLLDKIRSRVTSWQARHLSFAGRLQLIQSVLYNIIGFWASAFPLSKGCVEDLEKMLNAFLWSGAPDSARGAKVAWSSVCTSKESGGLGLRRISGLNTAYGIKHVWNIFAGSGSLWVAWVKRHYVPDNLFWTVDFTSVGSWIWRWLMTLRDLTRLLIMCHVVSGRQASFWHDIWTPDGPILSRTGPTGPMVSGVPLDASVSSIITNGAWNISARSRHPILRYIRSVLPAQVPDVDSIDEDYFLWRNSPADQPTDFSVSKLYSTLNPDPPIAQWHRVVWFKKRIPRHAFITWLVMRERMVTRDRLISWGMNVPSTCLLCATCDETAPHIFFECDYSLSVWNGLVSRSRLTPPSELQAIVDWLSSPQLTGKLKIMMHLIFQATIYHLWKERNNRFHSNSARPPVQIIKDISLQLRSKLFSLDRETTNLRRHVTLQTQQQQQTFLSIWFDRVQV